MRYALTAAVLILLLAAGCSTGSTSTTGSTGGATTEATTEATSEATTTATSEATVEATTEATTEATSEATTEATTEATSEATAEATTEAGSTMTDTTGATGTTGTTGMTDTMTGTSGTTGATGAMTDTGTMTGTAAGAGAGAMAGGATAHAELMTADGTVVGMAHFTSTQDGGVMIQVDVAGVAGAAAGDHGIHVHTVGACDPPDFKSAGDHFNPTNMKHGLKNPDGPHAGDLPNMTLDAQGTGTFSTTSTLFTLGAGANSLMDADGSALVIHANPDDEVTDPSGNSGDRIVCGVITADTTAQ